MERDRVGVRQEEGAGVVSDRFGVLGEEVALEIVSVEMLSEEKPPGSE